MANQLFNLFGALSLQETQLLVLAGVEGVRSRLPAALGKQTAAGSLSVTFASDEPGLPVSGSVSVSNFPMIQDVDTGLVQGLTNDQLRASPVVISGAVTTDLAQPLTDAQLRASAVSITGALTDTQLRASPVTISGTVTANTGLTQPLTNAELRASPISVDTGLSQPLTDTQLRASAVPISASTLPLPAGAATQATLAEINTKLGGTLTVNVGLTDTQLRATPVPVSGTVTADTGLSQPLTDTQLRANAVPVSAAALPLPSGAATESTLSAMSGKLPPALGSQTSANSVSVVTASDSFPINYSRTRNSLAALTSNALAFPNMNLNASLISYPYAVPELTWSYAAASGGIVNTTTAVTIKSNAGSGVRNYITSIQIMAQALGAATELAIRDGAGGTVLWRTHIPVGGLPTMNIEFPVPLRGSANTLLEVVTLTASVTGAVFFNAQGFAGS